MGELRFIGKASAGTVYVLDNRPGNMEYDPGERVEILTDDGKRIVEREAVIAALKELELPVLRQGMNLRSLSNYVGNLKEAKAYAQKGYIYFEVALDQLRVSAGKLGIPLDEKEIARITKLGFTKAYENSLESARENAANGDVSTTNEWIVKVRDYAKKAGIKVDEQQLAGILKQSFEKGYEQALLGAEKKAEEGEIDETKTYLRNALRLAKEAGLKIDHNRFKAIARKSLVEAYVKEIEKAARFARGEEEPKYDTVEHSVKVALDRAREYAEQAGIVFNEGYAKEILEKVASRMFREAEELAEIGFTNEAKIMIDGAVAYLRLEEVPYDKKKVESIRTRLASNR